MTAMIVDPPTDRSEHVSFSTVLANTGLTRRQLDFWCHRGYITAVPGERGSGRPRVFTADEYQVICHAYDLTALGLGPEQAVELARQADNQPVVLEHAHTNVVIIARTVPAAGVSAAGCSRLAAGTTDDRSPRDASAPTEQAEPVADTPTLKDPFDAPRPAGRGPQPRPCGPRRCACAGTSAASTTSTARAVSTTAGAAPARRHRAAVAARRLSSTALNTDVLPNPGVIA